MPPIRKVSFEDLNATMSCVLKHIDILMMKNGGAYKGSCKEYLRKIEADAIKLTQEEMALSVSTVKERWKILSMPFAVYDAIERGKITFSKAKLLLDITLDPENHEDSIIATELVEAIIAKKGDDEIKSMVKERAAKIWRSSLVVMEYLGRQNGLVIA